MKEVKLTKDWKKFIHSRGSHASWGVIHLTCLATLVCGTRSTQRYNRGKGCDLWAGSASIAGLGVRTGGVRKSEDKAKQDAIELAVNLLRDIRDGTEGLMKFYQMGEND